MNYAEMLTMFLDSEPDLRQLLKRDKVKRVSNELNSRWRKFFEDHKDSLEEKPGRGWEVPILKDPLLPNLSLEEADNV